MADNDVAKLIVEIDALRAELRAALASGNVSIGGQPTSVYSPAANALALHQMSAQGFVSGLTGTNSNGINLNKNIMSSRSLGYQHGPSFRGIKMEAFGYTNEYGLMTFDYRSVGANPANTINYSYGMPSWYKNASRTLQFEADNLAQGRAFGRPNYNNNPNLTNYINRVEHVEQKNMLRHQMNAEQFALIKQQGRTPLGRLWKRSVSRYTRAGAFIGGVMGVAEAIENYQEDDGRNDRRFLTNAEERAGITHADRYGTTKTLGTEILNGIDSAIGTTLQWGAMASFADRIRTDRVMQMGKSAFRQAGRSATGWHRPQNFLRATGSSIRGLGFIAGGLARSAINPVTAALVAWNLWDLYSNSESDLNTWGKRQDISNRKLKSQLDETNSYDAFTAQRRIDAALNERGVRQGTIMTGVRGGLSLIGLMDSPAQREDRIRERLSQDLSVAQKIAAEALVEAKLGNIDRAEKAMEKARLQAGDLVPAYWQDPLRVYTLQETASRSKACFARYLNNRTTNRSGD